MSRFDVIVVGGGHNGLIAAGYLARAGLKVLVLERRHEAGGGLCTEEVTLPGFRHNLHSVFHVGSVTSEPGVSAWPWYNDLELLRWGAKYISPPVTCGLPLSDGRCVLIYKDLEKTCEHIARFSKRDAEAYKRLYALAEKILCEGLLAYEDYTIPIPTEEREALLKKSPLGQEYLRTLTVTPHQYIDEFFEDEPLKAMLLYDMVVAATWDDRVDARGWLLKTLYGWPQRAALARGGSHMLAHALTRAINAHGGLILENAHVRRIVVEEGEVKGVELSDGRKFEACVVVSDVDTRQTFLELVGEDHIDPSLAKKIRNIHSGFRSVIFGVHLALNEPPKYVSTKFNPDIDRAFNLNMGYETADKFQRHWREIEEGRLPSDPGAQCASLTLFDSTQAPHGKHTAFLWQYAPFRIQGGGPEKWDEVKQEYGEVCVNKWREYAPNLIEENILATYLYTPFDITRKHINMREGDWNIESILPEQQYNLRPTAELSSYRTPVRGLYLCGASTSPGGAIIGGGGFNAAGVIADDLGVRKWWRTYDVKKLYEGLSKLT